MFGVDIHFSLSVLVRIRSMYKTHLWLSTYLSVCVCFAWQVEISVRNGGSYKTSRCCRRTQWVRRTRKRDASELRRRRTYYKNNNIINKARDAHIILLMIILVERRYMFKNRSGTHAFYARSKNVNTVYRYIHVCHMVDRFSVSVIWLTHCVFIFSLVMENCSAICVLSLICCIQIERWEYMNYEVGFNSILRWKWEVTAPRGE